MFQASCYLQVKSYNFKISKVQNLKKKRNTIYMCTKTIIIVIIIIIISFLF